MVNKIIRLPESTIKQCMGQRLDEIGQLVMLGEIAVANDPDDAAMKAQLQSLQDREHIMKIEFGRMEKLQWHKK